MSAAEEVPPAEAIREADDFTFARVKFRLRHM